MGVIVSEMINPYRRWLCVLILLLCGCRTSPPGVRPNVILISLDTLRADYLGCYGEPVIRTPVMDTLSRNGILFSDHHVNSNWTLPSHVSMLTSKYAADHRVVYDNRPLPDTAVTLAELFRTAGYRTGGFYSIHYFGPELNLRQGFEDMAFYDWVDGADWPRIEGWIDTEPERPFFLFLHTFEPHAPYGGYREYRQSPEAGNLRNLAAFDAFTQAVETGEKQAAWEDYREGMLMMLLGFRKGPDRHTGAVETMVERMTGAQLRLWKGIREVPISPVLDPWFDSTYFSTDTRALVTHYAERVMYTDRAMGRLLRLLKRSGRLEDTIVCVTSDHGEAFFEHGRVYGHGGNRRDMADPHLIADTSFHYEAISVPWLLDYPKSSNGQRIIDGLTSSLDIMPTLLTMAQLPLPGGLQGMPVASGAPPGRFTVAENQRTRRRAVITSGWKYIAGGEETPLYHRGLDPGETRNVAHIFPEVKSRMQGHYRKWSTGRTLLFKPDPDPVDKDLRHHLQLLGYLSDPDSD